MRSHVTATVAARPHASYGAPMSGLRGTSTIRVAAYFRRAVAYGRTLAASLYCLFHRAIIEHETRNALNALPDRLLKDVGIHRSEIDFVASTIASRTCDDTRTPQDDPDDDASRQASTERHAGNDNVVQRFVREAACVAVLLATSVALVFSSASTAHAQDAQIKRGKYLVTLGGCNDCHTPGYFFGKPDMARFLGGSEVGFEIPGLGVFHGPNLTPDPETGLGTWSPEQIATAITAGKRPDGRMLSPIMPWHAFASLTQQDVRAIAAFLKSLPPVKNKVPGPFGPNETPTSFIMKIVPPQAAETDGAATD